MDEYHQVREQVQNGDFTKESQNLPFQMSRNCEMGIADKGNIVIGVDFLAFGPI